MKKQASSVNFNNKILNKMKQKHTTLLLIAFFAIIITGCTGIYENGKELAKDIDKFVPHISVDSLKAKIEKGDEFLLIDVRQADEYNQGSIDVANSLCRGELEFLINDDSYWEEQFMYAPKKDDEIILFSNTGKRGALATQQLIQIGFTNVKNLSGGFDAFDPNHEASTEPEEEGGCGG